MINPKSEGFPKLLPKCRECAKCDPKGRHDHDAGAANFMANFMKYGCEDWRAGRAKCVGLHDFWPGFVPYESPGALEKIDEPDAPKTKTCEDLQRERAEKAEKELEDTKRFMVDEVNQHAARVNKLVDERDALKAEVVDLRKKVCDKDKPFYNVAPDRGRNCCYVSDDCYHVEGEKVKVLQLLNQISDFSLYDKVVKENAELKVKVADLEKENARLSELLTKDRYNEIMGLRAKVADLEKGDKFILNTIRATAKETLESGISGFSITFKGKNVNFVLADDVAALEAKVATQKETINTVLDALEKPTRSFTDDNLKSQIGELKRAQKQLGEFYKWDSTKIVLDRVYKDKKYHLIWERKPSKIPDTVEAPKFEVDVEIKECRTCGKWLSADETFCTSCGAPYTNMPEPHVPKWAIRYGYVLEDKCASCKHASKTMAILEWFFPMRKFQGYPCLKKCMAETYDEYEPRYTRKQKRAMSSRGKLKADEAYIKILEQKNKDLVQKGLEAVVKVTDHACTRAKEMSKHHADTVAMYEAKLAASTPLANAIQAEITTEKVETKDWKPSYSDGWRTRMYQVLRVRLPDGMMLDPRDVVVMRKKEIERP